MDINDYELHEICSAIADRDDEIGSARSTLLKKLYRVDAKTAAQYIRAASDAVEFIGQVMRAANRTKWEPRRAPLPVVKSA